MEAAGTGVIWKGAEELRQFLAPVEALQHHPRNPRRGDVEIVAESLGYFGQLKPIVIHTYTGQEWPYVVAGNHTLDGAIAEVVKDDVVTKPAWTHIAVLTPSITDEEADKFLLMDNRAADKATNDNEILSGILQEMMDAGQLDGTGYSADDYDDLLAEIGKVAETPEGEFTGGYAETPEETAARFTQPGEGQRMKEAVLMYPEEQFEEFMAMLKTLKAAWGIDGARAIIFESLRHAVANQGQAVPEESPQEAAERQSDGLTAAADPAAAAGAEGAAATGPAA